MFGNKVVVAPIQILLEPVILTTGKALTVTGSVDAETHPVVVLVKLKVADPPETPVTTHAFVTVAMVGSLLVQVPPVVGETPVNAPTQIVLTPVMLTVGGLTIVITLLAELVHPFASVTVTV